MFLALVKVGDDSDAVNDDKSGATLQTTVPKQLDAIPDRRILSFGVQEQ